MNVQLLPSSGQGLAKLSSHLSNDAKPVNETDQHSVNSHCILQSCPNYRGRKLRWTSANTNGRDYLVIIDYYSRWIEIKQLTSLTSACVISRVKTVFITHGVPDVVVSDNGRQFVSDEFKRFVDEMCFTQHTTNPYFAQENGMAERAVQTAKQLLDLGDAEIGLLNYRASSHSAIGVPPSVALMGRLLATRLPVVDKQLKPRDHQYAGIRKSDREAKSTYKRYYDKRHGVRELPPLQTGDPVLLKLDNEKQWSHPSTVGRRDPINRSYIVQTGAGVNYRRNRRHLQGLPAVAPYVVAGARQGGVRVVG